MNEFDYDPEAPRYTEEDELQDMIGDYYDGLEGKPHRFTDTATDHYEGE